jgi:hypothetical protein
VAKRTLEQILCDVCESVGERYTLSFPDGIKILDRCSKHDKKIQALREEAGDWTALPTKMTSARGRLEVTNPAEIAAKRASSTRKK